MTVEEKVGQMTQLTIDMVTTGKRHAAAFAYYARRALRTHADCLA